MIYCYCDNFFERSNYPKFYKQAVAVMRGANNIAFSRKEDFDVFVHRLKTRLEADKPKGHAARISDIISGDRKGTISIESGKDETPVARIYFEPVKAVVEYDMGTGRFQHMLFPENSI